MKIHTQFSQINMLMDVARARYGSFRWRKISTMQYAQQPWRMENHIFAMHICSGWNINNLYTTQQQRDAIWLRVQEKTRTDLSLMNQLLDKLLHTIGLYIKSDQANVGYTMLS